MYSKEIEELIDAILTDGVVTEKELTVLHKRAIAEGIDPDEIDVIVESRLYKLNVGKPNPASMKGVQGHVSSSQYMGSNENNASLSQHSTPPPPPPSFIENTNRNIGAVYKCPSCGSVVDAGAIKCTECGYSFRDMKVVSSRLRLGQILEEIDKQDFSKGFLGKFLEDERKIEAKTQAISSFPIPSSKDDLLEFLSYLQPFSKMSTFGAHINGSLLSAYKAKYKECLNKVRVYYNDDPQFSFFLKGK